MRRPTTDYTDHLSTPTISVLDSYVLLLEDLAGKDAIELGCGTAYVSAWLARRGARVVGIDNSAAQLATARHITGVLGWSAQSRVGRTLP